MGKEAKNGFLLSWPNMALSQKNMDKSIWSLILRDQKNVKKKKRRKKRRRGRGREEEEKRRGEEDRKRYRFYDFWYGYMTFVWILVRFGMDLWISCMEF